MARAPGKGIRAAAGLARANNFPTLSLSVEEGNPAVRLNGRVGFVRVALDENAWTMRLDLR
jgi:hypothetical protein